MRFDHRAVLLGALLIALWPVWRWMALRTADQSGESWELLALITALVLLIRDRKLQAAPEQPDLHDRTLRASISPSLPIALLCLYTASYAFVPPLVRGILAMATLGSACSVFWYGKRIDLPLCGLLLICLPVTASLNFYLGYPLRVAVGTATQVLLQFNGISAIRDGTLLVWNEATVAIDAPCSGIKMLWTGTYLCLALAGMLRLTGRHTALLAAATFSIILIANVLRATSLFYIEAQLIDAPPSAHEAIGLVTFLGAGCAVFALARRMAGAAYAQ